MWPTCITELSPLQHELKAEVPKFLRKAFNAEGILNDDEMFIPVRPVSILGKCSSAAYLDCPNIPEHHIQNSQLEYDDPADYFDSTGRYYWFDFDVVGLDGMVLPLRMVFNEGDGDCNDGLWGAVWERNTKELVANILSTGDGEATVEAVSQQSIDRYESQEIWVPTTFDRANDEDSLPCGSMIYANDQNLEKFIGLAIRLCSLCNHEDSYVRFGYDL